MSTVYGYDVRDNNDTYLRDAIDANLLGQKALLPGGIIVNSFPFCESRYHSVIAWCLTHGTQ